MDSADDRTSRWMSLFIGAVSLLMGGMVLGAVAGVVPADPEGFIAPRWVVAAIGVGCLVATAVLWMPRNAPQAVKSLVLWLGLLLVATVCNWSAFAPNVRYTSSVSIGPWEQAGEDPVGGRIVFGLAALLVNAILVGSVVGAVRGLWQRLRR